MVYNRWIQEGRRMDKSEKKVIDTKEYVTVLKELVNEGKELSMVIAGYSMSPFLAHEKDVIYFRKPDRPLKCGDMVFYQRQNGSYVMHRIWKKKTDGYYIVGDAQSKIEGPVSEEQIFALITGVSRKGKRLGPGDLWWEFFEHVWIRVVPIRRHLLRLYGKIVRK